MDADEAIALGLLVLSSAWIAVRVATGTFTFMPRRWKR